MNTTEQARQAIRQLTPGTIVGHANPELADWKGAVTANKRGNYRRLESGDVWVIWYAGNVPARDGNHGLPATGWIEATALTIAGQCPDCARPAHLVLDGNYWDRYEGWHHDSPADLRTCWVGKAAFEARRDA